MAMKLEKTKALVSGAGLKHFVHPDRPMLIAAVTGAMSR